MLRTVLLTLVAAAMPLLQGAPKKPLTNADILQMMHAGLSDKTIVLSIKANPANYDTSPPALIDLKNLGVSQRVLDAMLSASKMPARRRARKTLATPAARTLPAGGCPVEILRIEPLASVFGTRDRYGWELRIRYRNATGKQMVAEKFGTLFYDATHDARKPVREFTAGERVNPGETKAPHWNDGTEVHKLGLKLGVEAWPEKVVFADGTTWESSGSRECSRNSW